MTFNICAVKSDQLKWLPEGSQLHKETPSLSAEPKTYTSFSGNQLEVSKKPLGVKYKDIILAKLGPGQVLFDSCPLYLLTLFCPFCMIP